MGRLDRLNEILGETAKSAGRIADAVKGGVSRTSPEYVSRLKGTLGRAKGAVDAALTKVKTKLNAKLDAGEAEQNDFEARATAGEAARRKAKGLDPELNTGGANAPDKKQVAEMLANVYWLRTLQARAGGAPLDTKDIFGDNAELNKMTEDAIRAAEPPQGADPKALMAQLEAKLAEGEAVIEATDDEEA